jgi:hypothetical protein
LGYLIQVAGSRESIRDNETILDTIELHDFESPALANFDYFDEANNKIMSEVSLLGFTGNEVVENQSIYRPCVADLFHFAQPF